MVASPIRSASISASPSFERRSNRTLKWRGRILHLTETLISAAAGAKNRSALSISGACRSSMLAFADQDFESRLPHRRDILLHGRTANRANEGLDAPHQFQVVRVVW